MITSATPSMTASTNAATTAATPAASGSKKGCWIAAGIGCFILFIGAIVVAAVLGFGAVYFSKESEDNSDYGYDDELTDYYDNYNENINITDDGEGVDADGISHGFQIEEGFVADDSYAYQIGAYAEGDNSGTDWPALRFSIDYPKVSPMNEADDSGSLWAGVVLDNDYFIQVGMMSSSEVDSDGNMQWNYFWEMWDDQDNYLYGLQEPMSNYGWNENAENTFTLTCQDPTEGVWEFWVNDNVVGETTTGDCSMQLEDSYIFWEVTTTKTAKAELPTFGPFTLGQFEYWDGYDWLPVEKTVLSYSYGRIVDGTETDQDSVCPPYGAEIVVGEKAARFGSGLSCLPNDTTLWE